MQIELSDVLVDQAKTLAFFTKEDMPLSEHRWPTVVSPEGSEEIEPLLEPTAFAPARTYHH